MIVQNVFGSDDKISCILGSPILQQLINIFDNKLNFSHNFLFSLRGKTVRCKRRRQSSPVVQNRRKGCSEGDAAHCRPRAQQRGRTPQTLTAGPGCQQNLSRYFCNIKKSTIDLKLQFPGQDLALVIKRTRGVSAII